MNNKRFILVDDENAHNLICKIHLNKVFKNAEILSFTYPPDALDYLRTSPTEDKEHTDTVLLLDISMPVMDGFEVLDELETFLFPKIKDAMEIYVLSSTINDNEISQSVAHNLVHGFIEKPLTQEKIAELFV